MRKLRLIYLYEKENGLCWICKSRVLPVIEMTTGHPLGPSRDHVKIKPDKEIKYRLAHALCNGCRGRMSNKVTYNLSRNLRREISKQIKMSLTVAKCLN